MVYAGKQSDSEILATTPALPFQRIRSFGDPPADGWHNVLVQGDNLPVLRRLIAMRREGLLKNADGSDGVRLVYIDPPFASDEDYENKAGKIAYSDKVKGAEFIEGLRKRLVLIRQVMADGGSLFVHLDSKKGHYIKVVLDEIMGEHNFRNEIVWHYYNKMQGNVGRLASDHDTIYWYTAGDDFYFKPISVAREDGPKRMLKRVWEPGTGKLINAKNEAGKVVYIERTHKTADDVWRMAMLQPAGREMVGYPTQKPEAVVARILDMASQEGDLVLDCFVGSGTTLTTAEKMGRNWIGVDMGLSAIYTTQKRLLNIASSKVLDSPELDPAKRADFGRPARPFAVYAAGHYDFLKLSELPFAEYRSFVLRLFAATEQAETINGIAIDGRLAGDPVIVFDFSTIDADVTVDYFDELASFLARRAGDHVVFIAPRRRLAFYEDYITAGAITFDVRRVPFSVVNGMRMLGHQPASEEEINRMIETSGFDFAIPPRVGTTLDPSARTLTITDFRSSALGTRLDDEARGLPALAMVMVDYKHDGQIFDLDHVAFGEDLAAAGWVLNLAEARTGDAVAVSFCDLWGNERVEVFRDTAWGPQ